MAVPGGNSASEYPSFVLCSVEHTLNFDGLESRNINNTTKSIEDPPVDN